MRKIKSALTQIVLTILRNAEAQELDAKKIALLGKTLLAIERFPGFIPWKYPLRIYIKNDIGYDKLWRRIGFEEDNITLGNEESINSIYGLDSRWTLIFEHYLGADLDLSLRDEQAVADWCEIVCTEISSTINNIEIDYYDKLGWDVFDSVDDSKDDEEDNVGEEEDEEDEVDLDDLDIEDGYSGAYSNEPTEYNYSLVEQLLKRRYSRYIDGNTIHIGPAYFTVDMVVKAALPEIKNNPDFAPEAIIDRWVAYFQT